MWRLHRGHRWLYPLAMFLLAYFTLDLLVLIVFRAWGRPVVWSHRVPALTPEIRDMLLRVHACVLGFAAAAVGFRALSHHPVNQKSYVAWLRTTPWQPGTRLPLGSVNMQWYDYAALGCFCVLAVWSSDITPVLLLAIAALTCVVGSMGSLLKTDTNPEAYLITLGGSVLVWLAPWPVALLAGAAVLFGVAQFGLRHSLETFPWEKIDKGVDLNVWSIPIYPDFAPRVSRRQGVAIPLLLGAWTAALLHLFESQCTPLAVALWIGLGGCLAALIRVIIYSNHFQCPVSFFKRLFSGRWIIPGYDQIWVTPLVGAALSLALPVVLQSALPMPLWAGVTVFVVLAVLLNGGPVLRVWQLTGFHRAVGKGIGRRVRQQAVA